MRKNLEYGEGALSEAEKHIIATFRIYEEALVKVYEGEAFYVEHNPVTLAPIFHDNRVLRVDPRGKLFLYGQEQVGIDKIIGLLAIAKQKQNIPYTQMDEALLNVYQVVQKDEESLACINERLSKNGFLIVSPDHPGVNKILALQYAYDTWHEVRTSLAEDKSAVLACFISLYAHLNNIPVWLFQDTVPSDFTWDSWIAESLSESAGFQLGTMGALMAEILNNNIRTSTLFRILAILNKSKLAC